MATKIYCLFISVLIIYHTLSMYPRGLELVLESINSTHRACIQQSSLIRDPPGRVLTPEIVGPSDALVGGGDARK